MGQKGELQRQDGHAEGFVIRTMRRMRNLNYCAIHCDSLRAACLQDKHALHREITSQPSNSRQ